MPGVAQDHRNRSAASGLGRALRLLGSEALPHEVHVVPSHAWLIARGVLARSPRPPDRTACVHPRKRAQIVVQMPEVVHVHGKGPTKSSVKLSTGMDLDVRVVPEESFGAALNYFTGNKDHNVALRRLALARKLKLNEYGIFRGDRAIAGKTEEEIYTD